MASVAAILCGVLAAFFQPRANSSRIPRPLAMAGELLAERMSFLPFTQREWRSGTKRPPEALRLPAVRPSKGRHLEAPSVECLTALRSTGELEAHGSSPR